jgi:hypothetical protein
MTRWYYDDPLAAAWMAKHHAMTFSTEGIMDDKSATAWMCSVGPVSFLGDEATVKTSLHERNFYIHPDSLSLLKPQVGDLVAFSDEKVVPVFDKGQLFYHRREIDPYHRLMVLNAHFASEPYLSMKQHIIQRNGIAFHWPKREGA